MNDEKNYRRQRHGRTRNDVVMPVPVPAGGMPDDYGPFLENLKIRIKQERLKAVFSANAALILMYWDIGALILEKQGKQGWGAKIIDRLSHDLKTAFPQMSGFSPRNLKYMRKFADAWPDKEIVQRTVAQIPWRSNIALMDIKTIGLLLVKEKNQTLAKYALEGYTNPIGVANWEKQIAESLPEELKSSLPTIEEIEQEMDRQAPAPDEDE